jgi:hypothetical protein
VIFLITVLAFAWMSIGLGQRGQLVPQIVLSVTLVLLVLQLIFDISPSWQAFNRLQRLRVKVLPLSAAGGDNDDLAGFWADLFWFLASPVLLFLLGLMLGGGAYVFCYLTMRVGVRILPSAAYTTVIVALLWGVSEFLVAGSLEDGYLLRVIPGSR